MTSQVSISRGNCGLHSLVLRLLSGRIVLSSKIGRVRLLGLCQMHVTTHQHCWLCSAAHCKYLLVILLPVLAVFSSLRCSPRVHASVKSPPLEPSKHPTQTSNWSRWKRTRANTQSARPRRSRLQWWLAQKMQKTSRSTKSHGPACTRLECQVDPADTLSTPAGHPWTRPRGTRATRLQQPNRKDP